MDELYRMLGKERDADLEREARNRRGANEAAAREPIRRHEVRPRSFGRIGIVRLIGVALGRRSSRAAVAPRTSPPTPD